MNFSSKGAKAALIFSFIFAGFLLFGCVSQGGGGTNNDAAAVNGAPTESPPKPGNPNYPGAGIPNGKFGSGNHSFNGTQMEFMIDACKAKSVGDYCAALSPRGDEMNGTCESFNGTLSCRFARPPNATNAHWPGNVSESAPAGPGFGEQP